MKSAIASITALFALIGMINMSEAKMMEVQGSLSFSAEGPNNTYRPILKTRHGEFPITATEVSLAPCSEGIFLIQEKWAKQSDPRGSFILWETLSCEQYGNEDILDTVKEMEGVICPEIYQPVCGHNGNASWTYSNICHLQADKALFLGQGECSSLSL